MGGTPVDFFPILRHFPSWFPGTFYANRAREFQSKVKMLHDSPFEKVKEQMREGTARPSFIRDNLEKSVNIDVDQHHEDIKNVAAAIFGAGFHTTWSTLSIFILAMLIYPECAAKAQEELDRVLQRSRFPEFEDRKSLPYIECILQETYRWLPVVPLGKYNLSFECRTERPL
jgi:cytochrome P450